MRKECSFLDSQYGTVEERCLRDFKWVSTSRVWHREVLGEGIRVAVAPDSERFCKVEGHGQVLICAKLIPNESLSLLTKNIANL